MEIKEHLYEEQLILRYYGEEDDAAVDQHLSACTQCAESYRKLQQVMNSVEPTTPEPDASFESRMWSRIAPELPKAKRTSVLDWWRKRWVPVLAMAALTLFAFYLGRRSNAVNQPSSGQMVKTEVREKILLVAVGDHLDRSQMILAEIVNAPSSNKPTDIGTERDVARDLVEANRLYRQTATTTGDTSTAVLLDDLERVLLDIAQSPENISGPELESIRARIEAQGLLFKIRVKGTQIRTQQSRPLSSSARPI